MTPIYLLRDLSVSLTISNPLRTILTYNPSISLSSLTIQMPFDCTNLVSKKISLDWNSILSTLTGNANGNTTSITVSLGTCSIGYFTGAIQATVLESINGVASNSNSVTLTNYCGDYCRSCSIQKVCTGCFSSNTNRTLLSGGVCYDSCPSGSSISTTDSSACVLCHPSCQNCKGGSYLDCAACASGFTMTNGYCVSICGPEKYQSQQ